MRRLLLFLTNMDAKAFRALAISFVLFGGVGVVFLFGSQVLGFDGEATVEEWLGLAADGPWALPAAVAAFALLAFLGVPQFVLIAAAVVAFGPFTGFAYSWIGTMDSSIVGFGVGRLAGARTLESFSGDSVKQFTELVGRNGFWASLIVRLVPSAPFIVVNMAAGVTPMRLRSFLAGTGLGIIPKIVLTAFAGNSIVQVMRGEWASHLPMLIGIAAVWLIIGWYARKWLKAREAAAQQEHQG
ncbi:TVP38/TMEM64 family protein [Phenylobacterium sp.]|uniref:TVP38/TMEM64 family protein n=1 Tax=Phenylobacterium sp. TaxID=1871053 RepID=UPI002E315C1E|nr:TVP38/TMEM64 family protein [Phenylobacterium sp.]HEX2560958.1 TVP38/TMEM64 family protein [Phenylobacterium sp.]